MLFPHAEACERLYAAWIDLPVLALNNFLNFHFIKFLAVDRLAALVKVFQIQIAIFWPDQMQNIVQINELILVVI